MIRNQIPPESTLKSEHTIRTTIVELHIITVVRFTIRAIIRNKTVILLKYMETWYPLPYLSIPLEPQ